MRKQFERYFEAIGADRYKILCRPPGFKESEKERFAFVLKNSKGSGEGHTPGEFGGALFAELEGLVQRRYDLYLMPRSEKLCFFLVDDLTRDSYTEFFEAGFRPSVLQTTSPGNFQAITKAPTPGGPEVHAAANALFREINQKYGDKKIKGVWHFHRAPGTFNFKPERCLGDGSAPSVRLLKAENRICGLTADLFQKKINELGFERKKNEAEAGKSKDDFAEISNCSGVDPIEAFFIHHQDIEKHFSKNGVDYSTADFMVGVRMRVTGHTQKNIELIFEQCARSARPQEAREKHRDWEGYTKKTLASIFGERGTDEVRKYMGKKNIWLELERGKRRKTKPA